MENKMAGLPKGFYDVTDIEAKKELKILKSFIENGYLYGYNIAYPSEVGLQSNYLLFGSAALGRSYTFEDMGKNSLMLSSDSLASCIRAYLSINEQYKQYRMMAKVPVYRYRHKKYRRWNHLIYTIFQEDDEVMATVSLLLAGNSFLTMYYKKLQFSISFYGLFEEACDFLNCTHEDMYNSLFTFCSSKDYEPNRIYEYIKSIKNIVKIIVF